MTINRPKIIYTFRPNTDCGFPVPLGPAQGGGLWPLNFKAIFYYSPVFNFNITPSTEVKDGEEGLFRDS
jgi:hypothetical protein